VCLEASPVVAALQPVLDEVRDRVRAALVLLGHGANAVAGDDVVVGLLEGRRLVGLAGELDVGGHATPVLDAEVRIGLGLVVDLTGQALSVPALEGVVPVAELEEGDAVHLLVVERAPEALAHGQGAAEPLGVLENARHGRVSFALAGGERGQASRSPTGRQPPKLSSAEAPVPQTCRTSLLAMKTSGQAYQTQAPVGFAAGMGSVVPVARSSIRDEPPNPEGNMSGPAFSSRLVAAEGSVVCPVSGRPLGALGPDPSDGGSRVNGGAPSCEG